MKETIKEINYLKWNEEQGNRESFQIEGIDNKDES